MHLLPPKIGEEKPAPRRQFMTAYLSRGAHNVENSKKPARVFCTFLVIFFTSRLGVLLVHEKLMERTGG